MRRLVSLLIAFSVWPLAAQELQGVELRWPSTPPLSWSGIAGDESAGGTGAMMYPAPHAGGLLVAILTHALLVNGSREVERTARQAAADEALTPYRTAIEAMGVELLTQALKARLATLPAAPHTPRIAAIKPHFRFAPDHSVLLLDAHIRILENDAASKVHFDGVVQVVSSPQVGPEPLKQWLDADARAFREEVVAMLGHGVEIALKLGRSAPTAPARTQRYAFGNQPRMERGQPFAMGCGRVVLLTLREVWMSVPIAPSDPAACVDRYSVAAP